MKVLSNNVIQMTIITSMVLASLCVLGLLMPTSKVYAEENCINKIDNGSELQEVKASGLFAVVSIAIKGSKDGYIIATARNDFTLGNSIVQVKVELYSSDIASTSTDTMTLESSNYIADLNIGKTLITTANTNNRQKYWKAKLSFKLDSSNWKYKEPDTVLYNAKGEQI